MKQTFWYILKIIELNAQTLTQQLVNHTKTDIFPFKQGEVDHVEIKLSHV